MKVHLEPYSPSWPVEFATVKAHLQTLLDASSIPHTSIEHVGSTSIPSLLAKPVLDIDIVIPRASLCATRVALSAAGYADAGRMHGSECYAFRQPGFGVGDAAWGARVEGTGEMRRNTYVMVEGCSALRNHLDVRRVLREDEGLRGEYGRVKWGLREREFERGIGEYGRAKGELLWRILRKAGWSEEDLAELGKASS